MLILTRGVCGIAFYDKEKFTEKFKYRVSPAALRSSALRIRGKSLNFGATRVCEDVLKDS